MTSVNHWIAPDEQHAPLLLGFLLNQARLAFAGEDWNGLRQSHFRVLTTVPAGGISVTALAEGVGMTKQGVGQFVSQLVADGYLEVVRDPDDRRLRIVRRTAAGRRMVRAVTERNRRIEADWAALVGADRYAQFRSVLQEIATKG